MAGGIWKFLSDDLVAINPRLQLVQFLGGLFPLYMGNQTRSAILRAAGFRIGMGTFFLGMPLLTGPGPIHKRLDVGKDCWINIRVLINLGAEVVLEDRVSIGHEVMILTETHYLGAADRRSGFRHAKPVHVRTGSWLGSRATVLPGVEIGPGAVVGAGALVIQDVPANALVAGVPARIVRELPPEEERHP